MVDVFISYARRDRALIEKLADALQGEGFSVWWDHRIAGGAAFAAEIERALSGAKSVIVAWSISSVQSEWVIDEAGIAKKDGKLIPIRLDATHAPIGFRQYQEIDFSGWNHSRDAEPVAALARSISRFVRTEDDAAKAVDLIEERTLSRYSDAIAVLPLENFTGDPEQQYLVDGLHEALLVDLSKIGKLKVISRTSSKCYANTDKSAREIGAELGVSILVEGSVMRSGDMVRIAVQLIDARTDSHRWADSFDGDVTDLFKLQSDVAAAIADKINVALTPAEQSRLTSAPKVRSEAYDAYLKGMYHWYKLSPEDMQKALEYFDAALAADPDYAPAHAGVGMIWAGIQQMGAAPPRVAAPKIKAAADKALELDPGLFQAQFTQAAYLTWSMWDWAGADRAYQRAIDLNPNFPDTHAYYSHHLNIVGRFEEAEAEIEKALNLDPFNPLIRSLYGVDLLFWRRVEEAIEQLNIVIKSAPEHWLPYQVLRIAYSLDNRNDKVFETTQTLYEILDKPTVVAALQLGKAKDGYGGAFTAAADALADLFKKSYIAPTQIAQLYSAAGAAEQSAQWLEKGYEMRDPEIPYIKNLSRYCDAVMNTARVKALIEKLNYPE